MNINQKILYASVKPSEEIIFLFEKAKELDADGLGNSEILERAGRYLVENEASIDFKLLSKKKNYSIHLESLPASFKVRINDEKLYSQMQDVMSRAFNIKRIMTPFLLRVTLSAYVMYLETPSSFIAENDSDNINALKLEAISLITKIIDDANKLEKVIEMLEGV